MQGLAPIYAKNVEGDWEGAWVEASEGAGNQVVVEGEAHRGSVDDVKQGLGVPVPGECSRGIVWTGELKVRKTRGKKEGLTPLSCNVLSTVSLIPFFFSSWRGWWALAVSFLLSFPLHLLFLGFQGSRRKGSPTIIGDPNLGQEMGKVKKPAAAMALRAACSGIKIKITHTQLAGLIRDPVSSKS